MLKKKILRHHLMDQPQGKAYSKAALLNFERIKSINSVVDNLIDRLVDRCTGMIEQEEVTTSSPLSLQSNT